MKGKRRHSILGNLFFLLAAGLALLFACCPVAKLIPPSTTFLPSLLGFAFPLLLIINLALAVGYLFAGQRRCLLFIVCLLCNWNNIRVFVQLGKQNEPPAQHAGNTLKVLSYNVHLFDYYTENGHKRGDLKNQLLAFVGDQEADIVCFQEAYESRDNSFPSSPTLKKAGYIYATRPASSSNFHYGNRIYSKFPILHEGSIEGMSLCDIVFADIWTGKDTLRVYNMHLASYLFDQADATFLSSLSSLSKRDTYKEGSSHLLRKMKRATLSREKQVKKILNHIDTSHTPRRVIVCGDMNEHPVAYAYTRFTKKDFKDAFVKAGKGIGQSYQGVYPSYRIDYIFSRGNLKPIFFTTHKVEYSDHRPVSAVFSL